MGTTEMLAKNLFAEKAKEIYENSIRSLVETPENIGKVVALDTISCDFAVDADLLIAGDKLRLQHPDALIWFTRIGYKTTFAVGGVLPRQ
jgi:hypothetical protein